MKMDFTDGVVRIRPYTLEDIGSLTTMALASWRETAQWMPWCHENYNEELSESWIRGQLQAMEAGTEYSFVVEDVATGMYAGGNGINKMDTQYHSANLGYWTALPFRGRGYAARATNLLLQFGFTELLLERIEIVVAVGNTSSMSVAKKVGAVREGIRRHGILIGDTYHDAVVHSILRSEFELSAN